MVSATTSHVAAEINLASPSPPFMSSSKHAVDHERTDEDDRDDQEQLDDRPRVAQNAPARFTPRLTPVTRVPKLGGIEQVAEHPEQLVRAVGESGVVGSRSPDRDREETPLSPEQSHRDNDVDGRVRYREQTSSGPPVRPAIAARAGLVPLSS
jgi:hypothetical protein